MIKNIHIVSQEGLDPRFNVAAQQAIEELLACLGAKNDYPVRNLGNWKSNNYLETTNRYIEIGKKAALRDKRETQLNVDAMLMATLDDPTLKQYPQYQIILTKDDLYIPGLNFCTGAAAGNAGIVFSPVRLVGHAATGNLVPYGSPEHFERWKTVMMHELGHVLELTYDKRKNSEENLGAHCTHPTCVMKQDLTGIFASVTKDRLRLAEGNYLPICRDCYDAGIEFLQRQRRLAPPTDPERR
jgi:predicted Zn-dependent protease